MGENRNRWGYCIISRVCQRHGMSGYPKEFVWVTLAEISNSGGYDTWWPTPVATQNSIFNFLKFIFSFSFLYLVLWDIFFIYTENVTLFSHVPLKKNPLYPISPCTCSLSHPLPFPLLAFPYIVASSLDRTKGLSSCSDRNPSEGISTITHLQSYSIVVL